MFSFIKMTTRAKTLNTLRASCKLSRHQGQAGLFSFHGNQKTLDHCHGNMFLPMAMTETSKPIYNLTEANKTVRNASHTFCTVCQLHSSPRLEGTTVFSERVHQGYCRQWPHPATPWNTMTVRWKQKRVYPALNEDELEEMFIRGSGPGGQAVAKTSNCVLLKHLPTGIVVKCHESRSQSENRRKCRIRLQEKLDWHYNKDESLIAIEKREGMEKKRAKKNRTKKRLELKKALKEEKMLEEKAKEEEEDTKEQ